MSVYLMNDWPVLLIIIRQSIAKQCCTSLVLLMTMIMRMIICMVALETGPAGLVSANSYIGFRRQHLKV